MLLIEERLCLNGGHQPSNDIKKSIEGTRTLTEIKLYLKKIN